MKKVISTFPFVDTDEQKQKLYESIEKYKDIQGGVMPLMQEAQTIYGYLPLEVQETIAIEMGVPVEEVYGISTFYSQFTLNPKGKYNVSICMGTACYVKGSGAILERVSKLLDIKAEETTKDGLFSLTACRCVGACGLAPILMVNDEVYGRLVPDDVDGIIQKYRDIG